MIGASIRYGHRRPAVKAFIDRNMIRFIMWISGGPTDPRSVTDFTDWTQVEAFAKRLVRL